MLRIAGLVALLLVISCTEKKSSPEKATADDEPGSKAPDPRYPTAKSAGSEGVFALEEPDRGPLVTAYQVSATGDMKTSQHGHCEVDHDRITCGPAGARWRVSRSKSLVIAEELHGARVERTVALELDDEGNASRMIHLTIGVVDWSRHFTGGRYSSRQRSGANALPGCGALATSAGSVTCMQWMGEPMRDARGVVKTAFTRDAAGFVVESRYLDATGDPATRHDGVHKIVIERDAMGRRISEKHLDRAGNPRSAVDSGCKVVLYTHGPAGVREQRCAAADGSLAADSDGVAIRRFGHDGLGCLISERYFDAENKPTASRFRGYGVDHDVDPRCRSMQETCVTAVGAPGPCAAGEHARVSFQRDSDGDIISKKYFDAAGKHSSSPVLNVFEVRSPRDERGRITRTACFGSQGQAVECAGTGYHAVQPELDDAGRELSERFFDETGKPTTNLGTFETRHVHDNYDHVVKDLYLDQAGNPTTVLGASSREAIFDDGHRMFAVLLYQGDKPARFTACFTGKTCPNTPWHAVRIVRSEAGELISNEFFGADKQPLETVDCRQKRCFGQ